MAAPLTGCIVRGHGHGHGHGARKGSCGPAYHWENGRGCVHNGKAHGHHKRAVTRDHR